MRKVKTRSPMERLSKYPTLHKEISTLIKSHECKEMNLKLEVLCDSLERMEGRDELLEAFKEFFPYPLLMDTPSNFSKSCDLATNFLLRFGGESIQTFLFLIQLRESRIVDAQGFNGMLSLILEIGSELDDSRWLFKLLMKIAEKDGLGFVRVLTLLSSIAENTRFGDKTQTLKELYLLSGSLEMEELEEAFRFISQHPEKDPSYLSKRIKRIAFAKGENFIKLLKKMEETP